MKSRSTLLKYLRQQHDLHPELGIANMLGEATKLGDSSIVGTFNLPIWKTCCAVTPDSQDAIASWVCRAICYFHKVREGRDGIIKRADQNWTLAQREDFHLLLSAAIQRAGHEYLRLHDYGELFNADYIRKIAQVVRACPRTSFWCYSRAWRRGDLQAPLEELAALPNFSLLLSADRETGWPVDIPKARTAWLADTDGDDPPHKAFVSFRATKERTPDGYKVERTSMNSSVVCPIENGVYHKTQVFVDDWGRERRRKVGPKNCVDCGHCLFKCCSGSNHKSAESKLVQLNV